MGGMIRIRVYRDSSCRGVISIIRGLEGARGKEHTSSQTSDSLTASSGSRSGPRYSRAWGCSLSKQLHSTNASSGSQTHTATTATYHLALWPGERRTIHRQQRRDPQQTSYVTRAREACSVKHFPRLPGVYKLISNPTLHRVQG